MHTPKPTILPANQNNLKMDQGPGPNSTMVHNVHLEVPGPKKVQKPKKSTRATLFGNLFGERPQAKVMINKADISGPTDFVHIQGKGPHIYKSFIIGRKCGGLTDYGIKL